MRIVRNYAEAVPFHKISTTEMCIWLRIHDKEILWINFIKKYRIVALLPPPRLRKSITE